MISTFVIVTVVFSLTVIVLIYQTVRISKDLRLALVSALSTLDNANKLLASKDAITYQALSIADKVQPATQFVEEFSTPEDAQTLWNKHTSGEALTDSEAEAFNRLYFGN